MARKPQKPIRRIIRETVVEPEPEPILEPEVLPDTEAEDEETIRSVMSPFVGERDVEVKIYKLKSNGERSYCFTTGKNFTEEEIISHPRGGYGNFQANVLIGGSLRRSFPVPIEPPQAIAGGMAANGQSDVIRLLMDELRELREEVRNRRDGEPMSAIMQGVSQLIAATTQAQLQRPPVETSLDQMIKFAELVNNTRGGGADDWWKPALAGAIKEGLPLLGALASKANAPQPQNQQPQQESPQMTAEQSEAMFKDQIRAAFTFLKKKCLAGSDPDLYIDTILDNADEPTYQYLIHRIVTEDFTFFASIDAEIGKSPFRAFFETIYNGIRSATSQHHPMDDDTGRESGDAANLASDAKPGKNGTRKS